MTILAIDTSTRVSSVALVEAGRVIAELNQDTRLTHSERLMPQIKQLLDMAEKKSRELSAIAVSIGPGSFTGLRIGMATAKTMAYALGIPIIGVPTLDALAWNCPLDGFCIVPMLDAQKGNVYTAQYRFEDGKLVPEEGAVVRAYEEMVSLLKAGGKQCIVVGERQAIRDASLLTDNVRLAPPHLFAPRAASVALCAEVRLANGQIDDVMQLEPLYIRRAEAEVLWEKRHGKQA
ncbi:MAG: tRNA (adenosine(37)-N6)-threonylcarbamoyltransferase complex dimerization subunit type 1 TsaB [Selenomonadales bacterium]|nr:tRNA (adenosine(37)-N6)-threonylcarbamoyltransferase complex dimerization subunit type 1 TsaB [Selenomonadales bacterium]